MISAGNDTGLGDAHDTQVPDWPRNPYGYLAKDPFDVRAARARSKPVKVVEGTITSPAVDLGSRGGGPRVVLPARTYNPATDLTPRDLWLPENRG